MAAGADAVVFDLEDSVDAARKADARKAVADWLLTSTPERTARFVRVNAPGVSWIDEDLAWLAEIEGHYELVVVPKVESAADLERVAEVAPGRRVIPLLETARGIVRAAEIASAQVDLPALIFGAEDFTADLGIPRTLKGDELLVARSQVVMAAATIGADAIDAVFVDLTSPEGLREDALRARSLGFRGKMAIHPNQIAGIHEVFTPSAEEIDRARRLMDADAAARARGEGAYRFEDRMVDAPVVARARRLLALADSLQK